MRFSAKRAAILDQWTARLQDPDEFERLAHTLPLIDAGTARAVYDLGDGFVLKLPHSAEHADYLTKGKEANRQEWVAWLALSRRHPRCAMLTRIYACAPDGSWLIAERIEPHRLAEGTFEERLERFMTAFARYYGDMVEAGECNWFSLDMCDQNFGARAGRLVLLDLEGVGWQLKSAFVV